MFKKLLLLLLALSLLLVGCVGEEIPETEYSDIESLDPYEHLPDDASIYIPGAEDDSSNEVGTTAIPVIQETLFGDIAAAAIYDAETMAPIYEQNVHAMRSPASLTKMLTAIVAVRYGNLDDIYTVGSELEFVALDASRAELVEGYRLTLRDLLHGLLLCSGNDAAYTIAVNIARSVCTEPLDDREAVAYFCGMMNEVVAELELHDSHFVTPDGYEAEGQFSTAYDMVMIANLAIDFDIIRQIVCVPEITLTTASGHLMNWKNSNAFLHSESTYFDPRITGLKTGSTSVAGKCLVSIATVDGREYIAVILGCDSEKQRYGYTKALFDYVDNYK